MKDDSTFEQAGSAAFRALQKVRENMEIRQGQADAVAERIGSDDHSRLDGKLYEGFAEAAQREAKRVNGFEYAASQRSKRLWENLRDEDRDVW